MTKLRRQKLLQAIDAGCAVLSDPGNIAYYADCHAVPVPMEHLAARALIMWRDGRCIWVGPMSESVFMLEQLEADIAFAPYGTFYIDGVSDQLLPIADNFATQLAQLLPASSVASDDSRSPYFSPQLARAVVRQRAIKDDDEITRHREAARIATQAIAAGLAMAAPAASEHEIAAAIVAEVVKAGAEPGVIVVSGGERTALVDCAPSGRRLAEGNLVRIDMTCRWHGRWADCGRTTVVGRASANIQDMFDTLADAQAFAVSRCRPGMPAAELFFDTCANVKIPNFRRHHIGHGLGVTANEAPALTPVSDWILAPGMVLTIEVPYYKPGVGGILTEDILLITEDRPEILTDLPRTIRLR